ncbi:PD-(D/E)XK motif protein [Saccharospirillum alexandrii]|uniref:PD-(D/E)XK motif protein n=1 Tax=Saccharospirillum alexandrii TaxID=2448477 RepID=UPI003734F8AC
MKSKSSEFFLDNPWENISEPCYPKGRRLYLNDDRFWVSKDDNQGLLFFVQDSGADNVKALEGLAGLEVTVEKLYSGEYRLVCRLLTHDQETDEKFATVAKDIAFHCSKYEGNQLFLKTQERIKSWANFLRPSRTGLSQSEFIGLLGELYVLSQYIMTTFDAEDSVRAWVGLEGKKQDFTFNNSALEVKTTLSGNQQSVRISSLDQLDRVTNTLYLMRVTVSPSSSTNGFCLRALYEKCLEEIENDIILNSIFLKKVSDLYSKASKIQLESVHEVVDVTFYLVDDQFPKLTRTEVPLAIKEVEYEIAIGALKSHEVATSIREIFGYE